MNNLPFDSWTFKFHNQDHEQLFENFTDKVLLTVYKIITCCLLLVGFVFLIQFIIQKQPWILVILLCIEVATTLILYLINNKVVPHLKYLNLFLYVCIVGGSCYIALSGSEIPLYLYGFSCSSISLPLIQYSHYKVKMILALLFPIIYLFVFQAYVLNNLGFIVLLFLSQILLIVSLYYNEYFLRLSFSFYLISQSLKEILQDQVSDPMLAISFDQRTQQFKPEFENNEFRKEFQGLDEDYLKEFLRIIKIEHNLVNQSCEFRKSEKKHQTLEELCFILYNQKNQSKCSIQGKIANSKIFMRNLNIDITKAFLTSPILLIIIKNEKFDDIQQQSNQKIKYYKNLMNNFAIQITEQSEKLRQKHDYQIGKESQVSWFEYVECIRLLIINNVRNFWFLVNYGTIKSKQLKVETIKLRSYLQNIENYFSNLCKVNDLSFTILNFIDFDLNFTNSSELLSLILVNLFEIALKNSQKQKQITLEIQENDNLNPKNDPQYNKISGISKQEKLNDKFLITFKMFFFSERNIEFKLKRQAYQNLQNLQDHNYNDQEQFDIAWPVNCFALSRIGPYNDIEVEKALYLTELQGRTYCYQMIFHVYSDNTTQDQSYLDYVQDNI